MRARKWYHAWGLAELSEDASTRLLSVLMANQCGLRDETGPGVYLFQECRGINMKARRVDLHILCVYTQIPNTTTHSPPPQAIINPCVYTGSAQGVIGSVYLGVR